MSAGAEAAGRVRLESADRRLVAICLAVIAVAAVILKLGFARAFPEASITFEVTRDQAREAAERELARRGFRLDGFRSLGAFDHDDDAKVFLERTLGLAKANPLYGKTVPIWRWSLRWVKPLDKLEYRASVAPTGELLAFRRVLPEKTAAPEVDEAKARALAEAVIREMRGLDPSDEKALRFVESTSERRPARVDRTFIWESKSIRFGDAALRYLVEVQGDVVGRSSIYLEVPEAWKKDYAHLRSKNEAAGAVATFGLFLTAVAVLAVFVERVRRHDVKWRWALSLGAVGGALTFLSGLNELPLKLFQYDTGDAWGSFLARAVLGDAGAGFLVFFILVLLVAAGEPLYRESYPDKPALGLILGRRGVGSKRFFRGVLIGYAMTAGFVAYQVLFYIGAEKLGAWAPADVPYSNLLGTRFPWLAVLLMGYLPATTEEFTSRMFSIPFARRYLPLWAAVVVPAFIWGFGHAAYPNQPFYIRGVEVGIAGVVIGTLMLKADLFPLLVWHFTVDAVYTSLLLVRSKSLYFVLSGAGAAFILLLPLLVSIALYLKRGGFTDDRPLSNAAVGSAPPLPHAARPVPAVAAPPSALDPRITLAVVVGAAALLALARLGLPRIDFGSKADLAAGRSAARKAADDFLRARGDDPALYFAVPLSSSALPALEDASDTGADLLPYGWSDEAERWLLTTGGVPALERWSTRVFPGPVWNVRYVRPLDQHGAWVAVDGRTGRVVGFKRTFPEDEPGASLDGPSARALADAELSRFGLDPRSVTAVSTQTQERKARRDTRIVYESTKERAGAAPLRAVVEIVGDKPALVATALKLPEEFVRARERWTAWTYLAVALKVVGIGTLVGLVLAELLRAVRAAQIPWARLSRLAALLTLPSLLRAAASVPTFLRALPETVSLPVFAISVSIAVAIGLVLAFGAALLVLALVAVTRDDASVALARPPAVARSLRAALAAVVLVLAARALSGNLDAAFPLAAHLGGFSQPAGVETLLPFADVLERGVRLFLLFGGLGALGALLRRDFLRARSLQVVTLVLLAGVFAMASARTAAEVFVPLLGSAIAGLSLLAAVAYFLHDDPPAYLLAAAVLAAVRHAVPLAASSVGWWQANGYAALAVVAALVVLVIARGKRPAPAG